jgi:hypothetical protein
MLGDEVGDGEVDATPLELGVVDVVDVVTVTVRGRCSAGSSTTKSLQTSSISPAQFH